MLTWEDLLDSVFNKPFSVILNPLTDCLSLSPQLMLTVRDFPLHSWWHIKNKICAHILQAAYKMQLFLSVLSLFSLIWLKQLKLSFWKEWLKFVSFEKSVNSVFVPMATSLELCLFVDKIHAHVCLRPHFDWPSFKIKQYAYAYVHTQLLHKKDILLLSTWKFHHRMIWRPPKFN